MSPVEVRAAVRGAATPSRVSCEPVEDSACASNSKSLLSKAERGQKPPSPAPIAACTRALGVSTSGPLGQPYAKELRRDQMDTFGTAGAMGTCRHRESPKRSLTPGAWTSQR